MQPEHRFCSCRIRIRIADGCCKEGSLVGARVSSKSNFFFSGTKCRLKRIFFFSLWFELFVFERLYVCLRTAHKISVKGALGVGGGGKEWLKTYTSVRTGDGIVL